MGFFCRVFFMEKIILDACCGSRMFHFDKQNPLVLFADNRELQTTFKDRDKERHLVVKPDVIHDFTNMPYPDNSFKCVIFDPPHLKQGGSNSWLVKKYGKLNTDWQSQLRQGFSECFRVLDKHGILIFKWNETQIKVSEILDLTDYFPLIGHKSGKQSNTHWIAFIKDKNFSKKGD